MELKSVWVGKSLDIFLLLYGDIFKNYCTGHTSIRLLQALSKRILSNSNKIDLEQNFVSFHFLKYIQWYKSFEK